MQENKDQVEQKVREVADQAAADASKGALYAFFSIVLGAAAIGFGAKKGRDSKEEPAAYHHVVATKPVA